MKAERVRRWVLAGVRTCAPSAEGTRRAWRGGVGCPPVGLGVKGGGFIGGGGCQRRNSKASMHSSARSTESSDVQE